MTRVSDVLGQKLGYDRVLSTIYYIVGACPSKISLNMLDWFNTLMSLFEPALPKKMHANPQVL